MVKISMQNGNVDGTIDEIFLLYGEKNKKEVESEWVVVLGSCWKRHVVNLGIPRLGDPTLNCASRRFRLRKLCLELAYSRLFPGGYTYIQ